jgi:hypothetical protein
MSKTEKFATTILMKAKHDFPIGIDHDYKTQSGLVLRVTAVIRGKDGCIEYKNMSHAGSELKRVPREKFMDMVTKSLGFKGSLKG